MTFIVYVEFKSIVTIMQKSRNEYIELKYVYVPAVLRKGKDNHFGL